MTEEQAKVVESAVPQVEIARAGHAIIAHTESRFYAQRALDVAKTRGDAVISKQNGTWIIL